MREVWCEDFEFHQPPGERPDPICYCAKELGSGREVRLWADELQLATVSPIPTGPDTLHVAYYSSAEASCYLALGWPLWQRGCDLFTEWRVHRNGLDEKPDNRLLAAVSHFGIGAVEAVEKDAMRDLAIRGGPYTDSERDDLLNYCAGDVYVTAKLYDKMLPTIDMPRAMLRARYMLAVARMERTGIPIDVGIFEFLRSRWEEIKVSLVKAVDAEYGVYMGTTFKAVLFELYLREQGIKDWPTCRSGVLSTSDEVFRDMSQRYPQLAPPQELRSTLGKLKLGDFPVGSDGRNRCMLSAFRSKTGRNQPSSSRFIFGPAKWIRHIVQPQPGHACAYIDYSSQEYGIAACLSGDKAMTAAYHSGDAYMAFARQAGIVPDDATANSHPLERQRCKTCVLGTMYGMSEASLAVRLGVSVAEAKSLLRAHRVTYPRFWEWTDEVFNFAALHGYLRTTFGWRIQTTAKTKRRTLLNWPMQATGAEILRLACCLATERGVSVCAPIHDALLIEAPIDDIDLKVADCQAAMVEAGETVLDGFLLRCDASVYRYPDRYQESRGRAMWETIRYIAAKTGPPASQLPLPNLSQSATGKDGKGVTPACQLRVNALHPYI